jgi:hypothetical protein
VKRRFNGLRPAVMGREPATSSFSFVAVAKSAVVEAAIGS